MNGHNHIGSRVLYEDNHLLVINKLPSEIVQADKTGDIPLSELAGRYIADKYAKPGKAFLGVVHRIDRPVSGAVIFARTSKALSRMNAMLKSRSLEKTYWAVVQSPPPRPEGQLSHWLKKNEKQNKSYVVGPETPGARQALLRYRLLAESDRYHLLGIELITGRHHQIRAQLSAEGCPVKGDLKYGAGRPNPDGSVHLHARSIRFAHPVGGAEISIVAPAPTADPLWVFFENACRQP